MGGLAEKTGGRSKLRPYTERATTPYSPLPLLAARPVLGYTKDSTVQPSPQERS